MSGRYGERASRYHDDTCGDEHDRGDGHARESTVAGITPVTVVVVAIVVVGVVLVVAVVVGPAVVGAVVLDVVVGAIVVVVDVVATMSW